MTLLHHHANGDSLPPKRWQSISPSTERVLLDLIRAVVAISIVIAMTVLGINGAVDAAAVTGVLGAVVGSFGSQAAAAAATRASSRVDSEHRDRPPMPEPSTTGTVTE